MAEQRRIAKAAGLVSVATLVSRVLGYARDMVLAFYLGASGFSDAYFVAFRIPNLMRALFAEGAMSAAVIPVFTELGVGRNEEARKLARAGLGFLLLVVGSLVVLGIVFAPALVGLMAPGFLNEPEKFDMTVRLARLMMPFLLFISLAAFLMGILNSRRVFFLPALAPAMLNVTIITSVMALSPWIGSTAMAAAIGVSLGGLVQFLMQSPKLFSMGFTLSPTLDFKNPELLKIIGLTLPMTFGLAVGQVNTVVSSMMASYLQEGSITYLFYSYLLIQFPVGIFGVAMGTALLPSLSSHAANGDMHKVREDLSFGLRLLFFITIPAMLGLACMGLPMVSLLFKRGKFDMAAVHGTATALTYYSLGIVFIVGVRVIASAFYAMKDTKTPVRVATVALLCNVVLSFALMWPLAHGGLALANSLSAGVNFIALYVLLRRRMGLMDTKRIMRSFVKSAMAGLVMAAVGYALIGRNEFAQAGHTMTKAAHLGSVMLLCVVIYFLVARLFGSEEYIFVVGIIKERFSRRRGQEG